MTTMPGPVLAAVLAVSLALPVLGGNERYLEWVRTGGQHSGVGENSEGE